MNTNTRRPKGTGTVRRRGRSSWEVGFVDANGQRRFVTVHGTQAQAQRELQRLLGDVAKGRAVPTAAQRAYTIGDALRAVAVDYELNDRRSLSALKRRVRLHLLPYFGSAVKLRAVTSDMVARYQVARRAPKQDAVTPHPDPYWWEDGDVDPTPRTPPPASAASVNRDVAILRRAFTLAKQRGYLDLIPYMQALEEAAPRQGFLSDTEYRAIREELGHKPHVQGVFDFAFYTGWRLNEVLGLKWSDVDIGRRVILLPADRDKTGVSRPLHCPDQLWKVIETWQARRIVGCLYVFHHAQGKPVKSVRSAIMKAASRAGVSGFMFHNLRRTAARNLVNRARLSTKLARLITGHRTDSVFDRYNILADDDLKAAAAAISASDVGTAKAVDADNASSDASTAQAS